MDIFSDNKRINNTLTETSEVAGHLWRRGWAERNAGNISVNVSELLDSGIENSITSSYVKLESSYPALASMYFLVSGAERRMRDLARDAKANTLVIKIDSAGEGYHMYSDKDIKPTSEIPTHLAIHAMIAERGSNETVVMHTHATELIALTQIQELCEQEKLNDLLMSMHPETRMYIPSGVGFVPFTTPGSEDIAMKTIKALEKHDIAIWEKHGVFSIGEKITETFDLIDILAKSAKIYFMVKSSGNTPEGLKLK